MDTATRSSGDKRPPKLIIQDSSDVPNVQISSPAMTTIQPKLSLRSPPPPPLILPPHASTLLPTASTLSCSRLQVPNFKIFDNSFTPSTAQLTSSSSANNTEDSKSIEMVNLKLNANQRIISQVPSLSLRNITSDSNNFPNMLKTPPLICEQGPSAPSSPTSPSARNAKKPCPLSVDALQRFDLLSPNYVPSMDFNKLSPMSPGYPTSDLGSSPRSSISIATNNLANWSVFRDLRKQHQADFDAESDIYGKSDFLSPAQILSPAPFSPFSDYCASASETPYSNRSPNLSPLPHITNLHFNFDQVRSRSSMSNRNAPIGAPQNSIGNNGSKSSYRRRPYNKNDRHSPMHARSLDAEARGRSRSESEMLKKASEDGDFDYDDGEANCMINHSTYSVPLQTSTSTRKYKRRLLEKYRSEQQQESNENSKQGLVAATSLDSTSLNDLTNAIKVSISVDDDNIIEDKKILVSENAWSATSSSVTSSNHGETTKTASTIVEKTATKNNQDKVKLEIARQPTIEEPPPSPTFAELFQSKDLSNERQAQVEEWIRQQAEALEVFRNSLIPIRQEANLLQVPQSILMSQKIEHLSHMFAQKNAQNGPPGPMKPATLWRRSRSESDVSVPINDAAYICEHCGQGFAMHDRLAKHIASRHRDRSASINDENSKIHKCKLCPKSFGRSDMLTRHMRLHTGIKPYSCQICGQVFSRSDHLSTHQRTHTGEKPYRCPQCSYAASRRDMITRHMRTHLRPEGSPIPFSELQLPISQLSLNQPPTPEPNSTENVRRHAPSLLACASPNRMSTTPTPTNASFNSSTISNNYNMSTSSGIGTSISISISDDANNEAKDIGKSDMEIISTKPESSIQGHFLSNPGAQSSIAALSISAATSNTTTSPAFIAPSINSAVNNLNAKIESDLNAFSALLLSQQTLQPFSSLVNLAPPKASFSLQVQQHEQQQPTLSSLATSNATATKLISAVVNKATDTSLPLSQQLMLSTFGNLDALTSNALRLSTPNLLGADNHPSAFRPFPAIDVNQSALNNLIQPMANNSNASAVSTLNTLSQFLGYTSPSTSSSADTSSSLRSLLMSQSLQSTNSILTPASTNFSMLLRQNSIGGLGFVGSSPTTTTNLNGS